MIPMKTLRYCLALTLLIETLCNAQAPKLFPSKFSIAACCARADSDYDRQGPKVVWLVGYLRHRTQMHTRNASELVDFFLQQPSKATRHGLQLFTLSYQIPLTPAETIKRTSFQLQLHKDPDRQKSESELVEQLIAECDKRGVPLLVNTSIDYKQPWRLLTDDKTLQFSKDLKPIGK